MSAVAPNEVVHQSTRLRILATLLKADAGSVSINGFDVATQAPDERASISLTGQFAAVDEVLSGKENLVLVARLRHLENPGTIADELLARARAGDEGAMAALFQAARGRLRQMVRLRMDRRLGRCSLIRGRWWRRDGIGKWKDL